MSSVLRMLSEMRHGLIHAACVSIVKVPERADRLPWVAQ